MTPRPVLAEWGRAGRAHRGAILVDERNIAPSDFGGLARALLGGAGRLGLG